VCLPLDPDRWRSGRSGLLWSDRTLHRTSATAANQRSLRPDAQISLPAHRPTHSDSGIGGCFDADFEKSSVNSSLRLVSCPSEYWNSQVQAKLCILSLANSP
jgi:hypothetical protein